VDGTFVGWELKMFVESFGCDFVDHDVEVIVRPDAC